MSVVDQPAARDDLAALTEMEVERLFHDSVREWKEMRRPLSSAVKLADHPAYLRIIDLGHAHRETVTRLLVEELERAPDHWFIALQAVTGSDPVPPEAHGRVKDMAAAWVQWRSKK